MILGRCLPSIDDFYRYDNVSGTSAYRRSEVSFLLLLLRLEAAIDSLSID